MTQETPQLWKDTYDASTPEELLAAYGKWAHLYDRDTLEVMGYVGPQVAADMLDVHLPATDSRVSRRRLRHRAGRRNLEPAGV